MRQGRKGASRKFFADDEDPRLSANEVADKIVCKARCISGSLSHDLEEFSDLLHILISDRLTFGSRLLDRTQDFLIDSLSEG